MKLTKFILGAAAIVLGAGVMQAESKVVAHRGYWDTPGSAQNSIRALVKADSIGCWGSEFDVWCTPDGELVVDHDGYLNGYGVESTPSRIFTAQTIKNGEHIPTLREYFEAAKDLKIMLVCEVKPHTNLQNEKYAITQILKMAKEFGLEDRMVYITFSKPGFIQLAKEAPKGTSVQYLTGDYIPEQIEFMGGTGVDYGVWVLKKYPEWIKKCHDLGLTVNAWTVNKEADLQWCIDNDVDFITTNDPELLIKMLKENKNNKGKKKK